jgi:hypothetical protein
MTDPNTDLSAKVAALERRLLEPAKRERAELATQQAVFRAKTEGLADRAEARNISAAINTLAERQNVVIEWSAHDIMADPSLVVCCCCCCCCCVGGSHW